MIWKMAFRNLLKNLRRSSATVLAIGMGGVAALLFGGFVTSIWFGVQTSMIQEQGNLQVLRKGWMEYGAAAPDSYTIQNWPAVIELIMDDPELSRDLTVITPKSQLGGIAGNAESGVSKTFFGAGVVPEDVDRMRRWDAWNLGQQAPATGLANGDASTVIIGRGMARVMGLCAELSVPDCKDPPVFAEDGRPAEEAASFSGLVEGESELAEVMAGGSSQKPTINLLAASDNGAPNIARVTVEQAQAQAQRAVDDSFVMMHFDQAQRLLYGDDSQATALLVQVNDPARVGAVKATMQGILDGAGLDLEVLEFTEIDPTFNRIFGMFSFLFVVTSTVLAVVIIFSILNTVSMTVVERTREIGTIRALGFRRGFVSRLFLAESTIMGLAGACIALLIAGAIATLVNNVGVEWTPPSNATPISVQLMVFENPVLSLAVAMGLIVIAILASIIPTRRAARLNIVSALHHA